MIVILFVLFLVHVVSSAILIHQIKKGFTCMSRQLEELKAAVEAETSVTLSAVTLIRALAEKISEAKDDPAAVEALADQIRANSKSLADAIVANTASASDPGVGGALGTND